MAQHLFHSLVARTVEMRASPDTGGEISGAAIELGEFREGQEAARKLLRTRFVGRERHGVTSPAEGPGGRRPPVFEQGTDIVGR